MLTALQHSLLLIVTVLMLSTSAAGTFPPSCSPFQRLVPCLVLGTVPKCLLELDLKAEGQLCLLTAAPPAWDGGEAIKPSHKGSRFLKAGPITACCEQHSASNCPADHSSATLSQ